MDRFNKKGMLHGWDWALGFFFFLLFFLFMVGVTDLVKVEFFQPMTDLIRNITVEQSGNDSIYVLKQNELHNKIDNITIDWNLILIFMTGYVMIMSVWSSMQETRQSIFSLLFGTIGGLLFFIYIFHLVVIGIIQYFEIQFIGQIFGDLILNYVPFYYILLDNWAMLILVWVVLMSASNFMFGKETEI